MTSVPRLVVGKVGEYELAKLLMLTSRGKLEVGWPAIDDERRDIDVHVKDTYPHVGLQLKVSTVLDTRGKKPRFRIRFKVDPKRLRDHPSFWYVFALLEVKALGFRSPAFVISSRVVHKLAGPRRIGRLIGFTFSAGFDESANNRWWPYACPTSELGIRLMRILDDLPRNLKLSPQLLRDFSGSPGLIWVARRKAAKR